MRAGDVPVEILGLEIKGEGIGQATVQGTGDFGGGVAGKIGRCIETGAGLAGFACFGHGEPQIGWGAE